VGWARHLRLRTRSGAYENAASRWFAVVQAHDEHWASPACSAVRHSSWSARLNAEVPPCRPLMSRPHGCHCDMKLLYKGGSDPPGRDAS
jgi:hypothetical protein